VGTQVIFCQRGEDWVEELGRSTTPFHVLDKVTIELDLKMCINPEGTAELPKIKVNMNLDDIALRLSDSQIGQLVLFANIIGKEVAVMSGEVEAKALDEEYVHVFHAPPTHHTTATNATPRRAAPHRHTTAAPHAPPQRRSTAAPHPRPYRDCIQHFSVSYVRN
jgi:hypothetical protein